jgi:hypothetical protein
MGKTGSRPEYEVGFGRPPERTRFKKGQSGNPKGRPKGTLNLATVIERALKEKVVINENGQRKTITKMAAAMKQLVNQSASGNLAAIKFLSVLIRYGEEAPTEMTAPDGGIGDNDRKIMEGILRRLGVNPKEGDDDASGIE